MPITQDRMLALISAAQDYQQALATSTQFIQDTIAQYHHGQQSAEDTIAAIRQIALPLLSLQEPDKSPVTIALESLHFKHKAKDNLRRRHKQMRRRETYGRLPVDSAPDSIAAKPLKRPLSVIETIEGIVRPDDNLEELIQYTPGELSLKRQAEIDVEAEALMELQVDGGGSGSE